MENYILYCYKAWLKEKEGNLKKQLSKLPVGAIVLLISLLATLFAMTAVISIPKSEGDYIDIAYILMGIEILLAIISSVYSEKFLISHSKKNFENYKNECYELENLITQNGLSIDFIPILIQKFDVKVSEIEERIKRKHESVDKFMEMLLIPISAIILGAMLDKGISATETLGLGFSGLHIIFLIYGIIVFTLFLYDIVMRISEDKYKQFATDLQSFLDFKACEKPSEQISSEDLIQQT